MSADDEYMRGAADGAGWAPTATRDEIDELEEARETSKYTTFIYVGHSLAAYWGITQPLDEPVGDVDPWSDYGRGFYDGLQAASS